MNKRLDQAYVLSPVLKGLVTRDGHKCETLQYVQHNLSITHYGHKFKASPSSNPKVDRYHVYIEVRQLTYTLIAVYNR